jgi:hypothetical protein
MLAADGCTDGVTTPIFLRKVQTQLHAGGSGPGDAELLTLEQVTLSCFLQVWPGHSGPARRVKGGSMRLRAQPPDTF